MEKEVKAVEKVMKDINCPLQQLWADLKFQKIEITENLLAKLDESDHYRKWKGFILLQIKGGKIGNLS